MKLHVEADGLTVNMLTGKQAGEQETEKREGFTKIALAVNGFLDNRVTDTLLATIGVQFKPMMPALDGVEREILDHVDLFREQVALGFKDEAIEGALSSCLANIEYALRESIK